MTEVGSGGEREASTIARGSSWRLWRLAPLSRRSRVGAGLNANLIFKWIRRSREGWRDRRREPVNEKPVVAVPPERGGSAFVPVKLLELDAASAPPRSDVAAKPARQTRRGARRGAMREVGLPNGAKVSLDAEVDAEALVAFCRRWASLDAPVRTGREGLCCLQARGHAARLRAVAADVAQTLRADPYSGAALHVAQQARRLREDFDLGRLRPVSFRQASGERPVRHLAAAR